MAALPVGDRTLLTLSDGWFFMPNDFLGDPEAHRQLADEDGRVRMPLGCFLLPGDEPVLIDTGVGPDLKLDMFEGGWLVESLATHGLRPEDIRHVALSHLHADHVGWIATKQGGVTFPNAELHVATGDWNHFLVEEHRPRPAGWIRAALREMADRGRLTAFDTECQLAPGITALPAPGHTPGHTVYVIHDHGERAVLLGDAIYCPQQLTEVDWEATSDVDPALARRTRERLWREIEGHGGLAVGQHFPGLQAGRVLSSAWIPSS